MLRKLTHIIKSVGVFLKECHSDMLYDKYRRV